MTKPLTRPERITALRQALKERVLVLDGAMGTTLQTLNLTADDFGGPQLEGYRARVEQNGLAPSFRFTGAVAYESVPRLIAACDIALAPYTSKLGENERNLFACPMKVLEYMACGVPPIVTRLANSRCLVEDGVDGILIEEDSPAAIADAICYLLDSPERRAALGARARESALRHYSWAQHCRALNELFMSARGIC